MTNVKLTCVTKHDGNLFVYAECTAEEAAVGQVQSDSACTGQESGVGKVQSDDGDGGTAVTPAAAPGLPEEQETSHTSDTSEDTVKETDCQTPGKIHCFMKTCLRFDGNYVTLIQDCK